MKVLQFLVTLPDNVLLTVRCSDKNRLAECVAETNTTFVTLPPDAEHFGPVIDLEAHGGWKQLRLKALEAEIYAFQYQIRPRLVSKHRT